MNHVRPTNLRFRRALAVGGAVASVAVAAGCGSSSSHQSSPTTATTAPAATTPSTAAAPTTAASSSAATAPASTPAATPTTVAAPATTSPTTLPSGPQPCATSQLAFSLGSPSGAAGSTYVDLDLRNTGAAACTLTGYPGVSYVGGGNGTQIGAAAVRDPGTPVTTVTVGSGQHAVSQLRLVNPADFDPSACDLRPVQGLRVYPPGQTAAAFVPDPGQACASTRLPDPALFVGAVRAA